MNWRKRSIRFVLIMLVAVILLQSMVYAKTLLQPEESVYMGAKEFMESSEPHMGYSIGKPGEDNAAIIWNIVKFQEGDNYVNTNLYCV